MVVGTNKKENTNGDGLDAHVKARSNWKFAQIIPSHVQYRREDKHDLMRS